MDNETGWDEWEGFEPLLQLPVCYLVIYSDTMGIYFICLGACWGGEFYRLEDLFNIFRSSLEIWELRG